MTCQNFGHEKCCFADAGGGDSAEGDLGSEGGAEGMVTTELVGGVGQGTDKGISGVGGKFTRNSR